jgi:predicted transcriptional regulator of viral defense system
MLSVGETKASFIPVCKPTDGLLAVTYSSRLAHRSEFGLQHFQFRKTKKLANNAISQRFGFSLDTTEAHLPALTNCSLKFADCRTATNHYVYSTLHPTNHKHQFHLKQ